MRMRVAVRMAVVMMRMITMRMIMMRVGLAGVAMPVIMVVLGVGVTVMRGCERGTTRTRFAGLARLPQGHHGAACRPEQPKRSGADDLVREGSNQQRWPRQRKIEATANSITAT